MQNVDWMKIRERADDASVRSHKYLLMSLLCINEENAIFFLILQSARYLYQRKPRVPWCLIQKWNKGYSRSESIQCVSNAHAFSRFSLLSWHKTHDEQPAWQLNIYAWGFKCLLISNRLPTVVTGKFIENRPLTFIKNQMKLPFASCLETRYFSG